MLVRYYVLAGVVLLPDICRRQKEPEIDGRSIVDTGNYSCCLVNVVSGLLSRRQLCERDRTTICYVVYYGDYASRTLETWQLLSLVL